jgi:hypothetical protein
MPISLGLSSIMLTGGGLVGGSVFAPSGIFFNTSNTLGNTAYLLKSDSMAPVTTTTQLTFSGWFRMDAKGGTSETSLFSVDDTVISPRGFSVIRTHAGNIKIVVGSSGFPPPDITSTTTVALGTLFHVYAKINTVANTIDFRINGIVQSVSPTYASESPVADFNYILVNSAGANGSPDLFVAEVYYNNALVDFSKFISANKAISLGSTGEIPSGSTPKLYIAGISTPYNKGTSLSPVNVTAGNGTITSQTVTLSY